jgi:hypothetical protein
MQCCMPQHWLNSGQLHTMNPPAYCWCVGKNQVFPVCVYLVALCTCQYHRLSVHQWVPTRSWGSMLVMRLRP